MKHRGKNSSRNRDEAPFAEQEILGQQPEGVVLLKDDEGADIILSYSGFHFDVSYERIGLEDAKLRDVWGEALYRIRFRQENCSRESELVLNVER